MPVPCGRARAAVMMDRGRPGPAPTGIASRRAETSSFHQVSSLTRQQEPPTLEAAKPAAPHPLFKVQPTSSLVSDGSTHNPFHSGASRALGSRSLHTPSGVEGGGTQVKQFTRSPLQSDQRKLPVNTLSWGQFCLPRDEEARPGEGDGEPQQV